jgi:hypothetical protein
LSDSGLVLLFLGFLEIPYFFLHLFVRLQLFKKIACSIFSSLLVSPTDNPIIIPAAQVVTIIIIHHGKNIAALLIKKNCCVLLSLLKIYVWLSSYPE